MWDFGLFLCIRLRLNIEEEIFVCLLINFVKFENCGFLLDFVIEWVIFIYLVFRWVGNFLIMCFKLFELLIFDLNFNCDNVILYFCIFKVSFDNLLILDVLILLLLIIFLINDFVIKCDLLYCENNIFFVLWYFFFGFKSI